MLLCQRFDSWRTRYCSDWPQAYLCDLREGAGIDAYGGVETGGERCKCLVLWMRMLVPSRHWVFCWTSANCGADGVRTKCLSGKTHLQKAHLAAGIDPHRWMYLKESAALAAIAQKTRSEQWGKRLKMVHCASFGAGDAVRTRRGQALKMFVYMTRAKYSGHWDVHWILSTHCLEALPADGRLVPARSINMLPTLPKLCSQIPHMAQKSMWN